MGQPLARRPCPCGSGRTLVSCCGALRASELAAWERVQQAEDRLMPQIVESARKTWGLDLFTEALRLFLMSRTSAESNRSALPAFERWFALVWVPDCCDPLHDDGYHVPEGWPTTSLGVTWLASGSSTVGEFEQTLIVTAARSPHSLLLIESVIPGWSLVVRDLLTGRRFRVVEPEISEDVRSEQILFSAILTIDGVSTLLGCGSHAVPSNLRVMAGQMREYHVEGAWLTRAALLDITTQVCSEYRDACDGETVIELETYGEAPEPLLLRWNVSSPFGEMFERLRSLSVWYGEEEAIDDETGPDGVPRLLMSWYEPPPPPEPKDRRALGFLYLDVGRLAADVATRAIADRLMGEISARLGSAATLVETRPSLPVRIHSRSESLPTLPRG
jgi:hypothetical protein